MNAHRGQGGDGKTPFGTKVIIWGLVILAVVLLTWAWVIH